MYLPKINSFFSSLKLIKQKYISNNNLNIIENKKSAFSRINSDSNTNNSLAFFIYNNESVLLMEKILLNPFKEDTYYNIFSNDKKTQNYRYEEFKKIASNLIVKLQKRKKNSENFDFIKIYFKQNKILILDKNPMKIVGIFANNRKDIYYEKLILINIYMSIINFLNILELDNINNSIINIQQNTETQISNTVNQKIHKDFVNQNSVDEVNKIETNEKNILKKPSFSICNSDHSIEDFNNFKNYCKFKIFEKFYFKSITNHFSIIYSNIIEQDDICFLSLELDNIY